MFVHLEVTEKCIWTQLAKITVKMKNSSRVCGSRSTLFSDSCPIYADHDLQTLKWNFYTPRNPSVIYFSFFKKPPVKSHLLKTYFNKILFPLYLTLVSIFQEGCIMKISIYNSEHLLDKTLQIKNHYTLLFLLLNVKVAA